MRTITSSSAVATRDDSCPVHIAGSARTLTRSLMQRWRRVISMAALSVPTSTPISARTYASGHAMPLGAAALAQLSQELVRRYEERVLLEDSADDDHGVGAHDLDNDVTTEPGEIVRANDRVLEGREVRARLVFEQGVHTRPVFEGPFHVRDEPNAWVSVPLTALPNVGEQSERPSLIEESSAQVGVRPLAEIQLTGLLRRGRIDSYRSQAPNVLVTAAGIDDVNRLFATVEAVFDERQ